MDQTRDASGREMYRLSQLYAPPEFVKQASTEALCGGPGLHNHQFADPAHRAYPVHTGPATWMSAAFFFDKRSNIEPVVAERIESNLLKLASFHGIRPQVEALRDAVEKTAQASESALPDDAFAYVWKSDDGSIVNRKYPLRNQFEVKAAAEYIEQYRDHFPLEDRQRMARRILAKASEFSVALADSHNERLEKIAGFGFCAGNDVADAYEKRASLLENEAPTIASQLKTVGQNLRDVPEYARKPETLQKVALNLDSIDRAFNLVRHYDTLLERPEEALFKLSADMVQAFEHGSIATVTGNVYERTALEKLSLEKIQEFLGQDIAESVTSNGLFVDGEKLAAVVPTLPRGDAEIFDELVMSVGIQPFAKKAEDRSDEPRLVGDNLYAVAALHG